MSSDRGTFERGRGGRGGYRGRGGGEGGQRGGYSNRGSGVEGYGSRGGYGSPSRGGGGGDGYGSRGGYGDRGGRGGFRGNGEYRGGRGGYGGTRGVSSGMQSMSLGDEPAPLDFIPPKEGEQEKYMAAPKPAPAFRQGKKTFEVQFNSWRLEFKDGVVHSYDVSIGLEAIGNDGSTRIVNLNKGPKDDASMHDRSELIKAAIKAGLEYYNILTRTGAHISDGASLLFTNESLNTALKQHENNIAYPMEELISRYPEVRRLIRTPRVKSITIQVTGCKSFNIRDEFSKMTNIDRSEVDQTAKQFFELLTTDYGLTSHTFDFFKGGKLFRTYPEGRDEEFPKIEFGQERRPGLTKGVFAASKDGSIFPALNIDVTTGTFWCKSSLEETILKINRWETSRDAIWNARTVSQTQELIKGLRVSYTPSNGNQPFQFQINGLSASFEGTANGQSELRVKTMETQMVTNGEGIEEPLFNKFNNVDLRLMKWPLVVSKRTRRSTDDPTKYFDNFQYFPIELLNVKPHQRVPLNKQGSVAIRPIRVDDRWRRTGRDLEALNLFADTKSPAANPILKAFGVRLSRSPLTTKAITRRMPTVTFNDQSQHSQATNVVVNEKTTFYTNRTTFDTPAHINKLYVAFSTDPKSYGIDPNKFVRILVDAAKNKKMKIDNCIWDLVEFKNLLIQLRQIKEQRHPSHNILFLYIEPASSDTHNELKLFERYCFITTQHLKMESAKELYANNRPMMENVLLKLNIKGGGHNYRVTPEKFAIPLWMDGNTMILGYDVWHPTGQTRADKMTDRLPDPSVVGFSFNGGIKSDSFIGDYHYQQATKERVKDEVLNARIKWMLGIFEKNRGVLPPFIIVVRDGISDGQHRHGMDELEALREGALEYAVSIARTNATGNPPNAEYSPKFIFAVATKRHHMRAYTEGERGLSNMPAMSVVDDTITNPVLFEFFMQSHTPLQGMAKATKYNVLKDDVGTNQDAMQSLMGALCFEHQITNSAISIPEPVYQSDEWAKRGASNAKKYKEMWGDRVGLTRQFKKEMTYEKLTDLLSYWNTPLERIRVNA